MKISHKCHFEGGLFKYWIFFEQEWGFYNRQPEQSDGKQQAKRPIRIYGDTEGAWWTGEEQHGCTLSARTWAATLSRIVCTLFVPFSCFAKLNFSFRGSIQIHLYLILMWPSTQSYSRLLSCPLENEISVSTSKTLKDEGELKKKSQKAQSKLFPRCVKGGSGNKTHSHTVIQSKW